MSFDEQQLRTGERYIMVGTFRNLNSPSQITQLGTQFRTIQNMRLNHKLNQVRICSYTLTKNTEEESDLAKK